MEPRKRSLASKRTRNRIWIFTLLVSLTCLYWVMLDTEHNPLAWRRHHDEVPTDDAVPDFLVTSKGPGVVQSGAEAQGGIRREDLSLEPPAPLGKSRSPQWEEPKMEEKKEPAPVAKEAAPVVKEPEKPKPPPPADKETPKDKSIENRKQMPLGTEKNSKEDNLESSKKPTKEQWEKGKPADLFGDQPKTDQWKDDTPNVPSNGTTTPPGEIDPFERMHDGYSEYPPPDRPFMYLSGFKLCTCLNNASFFTDIPLDLPDGETDLYSGSATKVVQLIDYSVNQILSHPDRMRHYQRETTITNTYKADLPLRGICFTIAQGNIRETDTWRPFVEKREPWEWRGKHGGRILRTIDSRSALPFLNYEGQYSLQAGKQRKHYNLAYILLVHENFENIKLLVEALDDPTVFIYIHVDLASPNEFHEQIHSLAKEKSNIAVMGTQFSIIWGHMSLLWVEVRAFFDLLDLIEFDYVVNLSGSDYPLKSAKTIYQTLERKPGSNWIYWSDGRDTGKEWELEMRTEHLFQCVLVPEEPNLKQCQFGFKNQGYEWRPWDGFKQLYPRRYKTSQWIILHSSAVKWLRTSEAGKLLMVWAENTLIPDEMILATLFASSPFVNKTYKDPKRLMRWLGNPHPESWWHEDKDDIWSWAKHFLWIRKVDLTEDPELKVILDEIRKWDVMGEEIVAPYADGIIPVD